jgi:hypothetical protein
VLGHADVAAVSRQVELALFYDGKIDCDEDIKPERNARAVLTPIGFARRISQRRPATPAWRGSMKGHITKFLVNFALLATLVVAESADAQMRAESAYPQTSEVFDERPPATADDSCQTGKYGPHVRVQPGDVVEDGEVVGRDPDPNIRSQLQREYEPGGYEC